MTSRQLRELSPHWLHYLWVDTFGMSYTGQQCIILEGLYDFLCRIGRGYSSIPREPWETFLVLHWLRSHGVVNTANPQVGVRLTPLGRDILDVLGCIRFEHSPLDLTLTEEGYYAQTN